MTSISQLRTIACLALMGSVGTSSVVSAESQINGQGDPNQRIDALIQEIAKQRDELDALQRELVLQRARFNTLSRELHTGLAAQRARGASGSFKT